MSSGSAGAAGCTIVFSGKTSRVAAGAGAGLSGVTAGAGAAGTEGVTATGPVVFLAGSPAGAAAVVEHADGQPRQKREDRPERNQRADHRHRNAHVIEIRRNHGRSRIALDGHRNDGHQKFEGAEFHISLFIL